jgi:hypothetical protein
MSSHILTFLGLQINNGLDDPFGDEVESLDLIIVDYKLSIPILLNRYQFTPKQTNRFILNQIYRRNV